jgi:23S rRNA (uridine2552-2'-O)-methyltransferase
VTGQRPAKVRLQSGKRRKPSSSRWLVRQLNDPYVQRAQTEGYRSRAAYKLLEIDRRFRLLRAGQKVADLGCAPGGWTQVAAARGARVVGVDLLEMPPIEGAILLQADAFDPATATRMQELAGGRFDLVLSDVSPSATGKRAVDRLRAEAAAEAALDVLPELLAPSGNVVIKLLRGIEGKFVSEARARFAEVKLIRPEATRSESSEIYLVGLGWRGEAAAWA